MQATLKIYLAGPDVFFREPLARGQQLRARCAAFGFDGRFPMDATLPPADEPSGVEANANAHTSTASPDVETALPPTPSSALRIYRANIALLRGCDAVMANLQDFRGKEPDSGTVFEVGYAVALGLPVWGYGAPAAPIIDQIPHDAAGRDNEDLQVEDFALPRNLMLACSIRIVEGDADACLADMRTILSARTQPFVPGWVRGNATARSVTRAVPSTGAR